MHVLGAHPGLGSFPAHDLTHTYVVLPSLSSPPFRETEREKQGLRELGLLAQGFELGFGVEPVFQPWSLSALLGGNA